MSAAKTHPFEVGQEVVVSSYNGPDRPGTVMKIGSVRVTVRYSGSEQQFHMQDRCVLDGYGHEQVHTPAERAEQLRSKTLLRELRNLGVETYRATLTSEQRERILAIAKEVQA